MCYTVRMKDKKMNKDKVMGGISHYTLWLGCSLIKTESHTREGLDNLLEVAQTYCEKGRDCSIFSSREEEAIWDSKWAEQWMNGEESNDLTIDEEELVALCEEGDYLGEDY